VRLQFRNKYGRAGKKSSRQLLGTYVQVDGYKARALLDPGCEAELVLSTSFATQCGMSSQVDEETLVEFAEGTRVPSTFIENVSLSFTGVSHPVRAVVVELAAYGVILGKCSEVKSHLGSHLLTPVRDCKHSTLTGTLG
jgi:hypothetical protein